MRLKLFAGITFCVIIFAHCDEPAQVTPGDVMEEAGFTGRWKQTAEIYSIGGPPIIRYLADTAGRYLQFNADSTIETNMQAFATFRRYSHLKDSSLLFTANDQSTKNYSYRQGGDSLDIYFRCIEACGVRLKRAR
jgi:hypothetical protein